MVAYPTESFYGLGVNIHDEEAIQRLFLAKERSPENPILLLAADIRAIQPYIVEIPPKAALLMDRFWPGGLTVILEAGPSISPLLTAGTGKIGMRVSGHPDAAALTQCVGFPVTGTSANISGQPACMHAREVLTSMGDRVDLILDGGKTAGGPGSTIVDVTEPVPRVIREGMIDPKELTGFLKTD
jgi:L-threonylcarbamoyladenylate synthase